MWTLCYLWSKQKDSRFPRRRIQLKQINLRTLQKAKQWTRLHQRWLHHPPNIIADIPKAISKRSTNISCNKNTFDRNVSIYQAALKNSGSDGKITYNDQSEQTNNVNIEEANQARKRKRAIIWYNPPYSMNVKTNIG